MAYPFELPTLGYDYAALEPHIDARTMEIHHTKHHQAYTDKLNGALEKHKIFHEYSDEQLLRGIHALPEELRAAVRNHGGGYQNHSMFWSVIAPGGGTSPSEDLGGALTSAFGSLDGFKTKISTVQKDKKNRNFTNLAVQHEDSRVSKARIRRRNRRYHRAENHDKP